MEEDDIFGADDAAPFEGGMEDEDQEESPRDVSCEEPHMRAPIHSM
jgi:hypothetical protein